MSSGTHPQSAADLTDAGVLHGVDDVVELFERWGSVHYDDRVSQLDHALQCASLAERAGAAPHLVVAALLHDIGHLIELDRTDGTIGDLAVDRGHEHVAARALAALFGPEVRMPIELHVEAKRFLCAIEPGYAATLSDGSVRSLATQGGAMTAAEVARFASRPDASDAADVRRWDDAGKVEQLVVAPLAHFVPLLRSLASSAG
ncbi:MAG: HD domain-containing protein [Acidimicrobiales bacterium]|nr:HD domain-containing protein [Acidimicrobiales bacterium]MCB9393477.1 HD domain-containing protein [Acidimicrobiaceae bacterium]